MDRGCVQFSAMEKRVFDYLTEQEKLGRQATVGEVCKACHTTVKTLLGKTMPAIGAKIRAANS